MRTPRPRLHRATALAIALFLCACATPVKLYEGPARPEGEIALLEAPGNATILQVDGREVDRLDTLFALEPGPHVILFRVRRTHLDFGSRIGTLEMGTHAPQYVTICFVTAEMQAGHRYVVVGTIESVARSGSKTGDWSTMYDGRVVTALVDDTTQKPVPDLRCQHEGP